MFKGNRIVRVIRYQSLRDAQGGAVGVITGLWKKWATVDDRFGSTDVSQQHEVWNYEQRIVMRYEHTRRTHSNDLIEYEGTLYKINSLSIKSEGYKTLEICRCVKSDELINNIPPMSVDNIQVVNYYGVNNEVTWQDDRLIGKNYFGAFKDGAEFEIIPNELTSSTTPDVLTKQVYINAATGAALWSQQTYPNEHSMIQLY